MIGRCNGSCKYFVYRNYAYGERGWIGSDLYETTPYWCTKLKKWIWPEDYGRYCKYYEPRRGKLLIAFDPLP